MSKSTNLYRNDVDPISECKPEVLGLGNGTIPVSSITVSSEDKDYPKSQLGEGMS